MTTLKTNPASEVSLRIENRDEAVGTVSQAIRDAERAFALAFIKVISQSPEEFLYEREETEELLDKIKRFREKDENFKDFPLSFKFSGGGDIKQTFLRVNFSRNDDESFSFNGKANYKHFAYWMEANSEYFSINPSNAPRMGVSVSEDPDAEIFTKNLYAIVAGQEPILLSELKIEEPEDFALIQYIKLIPNPKSEA